VRAGEILALIGPNGAGKSTMFNHDLGRRYPTRARCCFHGPAGRQAGSREIAALGMSRTFQHVRCCRTMSVLENVAIGAHLRGHKGVRQSAWRLDRAEEAPPALGGGHQIERCGLGEHMHDARRQPAAGPAAHVEIARALCADPCLLLLDEPAAGLRHKEKQALAELLRKLRAEGMATLMVEHDMDFVMGLADRVVVMEFGRRSPKACRRNPANPKVLEAYLGGAE
jgi:branched-chain amino acid transport system permease protein